MDLLILNKLVMTSFMAYHDGPHVLTFQKGAVYVQGVNHDPEHDSNGGGKSTIGHAISWCLHGEISTEIKKDDVINYEADECCVEVHFNRLVVQRAKRRGEAEKFTFWHPNTPEDKCGLDLAPAQAQLYHIIGLNKELYFNALWLDGASKTVQFLFKKASERLQILIDLTGGERIRTARKKAADRLKELGSIIEKLQDQIEHAKREATKSKDRISDLTQAATQESYRIEEEERTRGERLQTLLDEKEGKEILLDSYQESFRKLIDKEPVNPSESNANLRAIEARRKDQNRIVLLFNGDHRIAGRCPTCERPFKENEAAEARKAYQTATNTLAEIDRQLANEKANIGAIQDRWTEYSAKKDRLERGILITQSEISSLERQHAAASSQTTNHDSWNNLCKMLTQEKETLQQHSANLTQHEISLHVVEQEVPDVKFWVDAFGAKGIQNLLLDDIRSLIAQFTSQYIYKLGGGVLGMEFPPGDKGFEVLMVYRDRKVRVGNLSRGEVGRNMIAFILGFRRALLYLNRCSLDFLVLDDVQESMDDSGLSNILGIVDQLSDEISNIIITMPRDHEDVRDENKILVEKKDGRSTIL